MPLMRVDVVRGHDENYLKKLLAIAYEVQLEVFQTPLGDRYQILTQHEAFEMQILDTGLGLERSENVVLFNLITRARTTKAKQAFYDKLAERLHAELGLRREELVVSLVTNNDDDWSFGLGRAQFLSGEL